MIYLPYHTHRPPSKSINLRDKGYTKTEIVLGNIELTAQDGDFEPIEQEQYGPHQQ